MFAGEAGARQPETNLALDVRARGISIHEPAYDAHEHFGDRPLLPMRWRLVKPIDGLPLPVGERLHLNGHRHGSTHDNGGWDWLTLMVTVLDGEHAGERYIVISSAAWRSSPGLAAVDLLPPHLTMEAA